MHRRFFSALIGFALALMGSLFVLPAASAAVQPLGIGIVQMQDAPDHLAPMLALADVAVLPARLNHPEPSSSDLIDMAGIGSVSPIYSLSYSTDGASLSGFQRRC